MPARDVSTVMGGAVIFLVRHGETEWNRVHRYQGWGDSPLTARGVAQAEAIGRRLSTLREAEAAEIVASPIGRARCTAEIIRGQITNDGLCRAASLRFDERLREISIGAWDGLNRDEIAALSPGIFDGDGRHEWYFRTPEGETYDDFAARIAGWLRTIRRASRTRLAAGSGDGWCSPSSSARILAVSPRQQPGFRHLIGGGKDVMLENKLERNSHQYCALSVIHLERPDCLPAASCGDLRCGWWRPQPGNARN